MAACFEAVFYRGPLYVGLLDVDADERRRTDGFDRCLHRGAVSRWDGDDISPEEHECDRCLVPGCGSGYDDGTELVCDVLIYVSSYNIPRI